jgi:cell division protein FtsB
MPKGNPTAVAHARRDGPPKPPSAAGSTHRRRMIQLILVFISCVLVVDALVGDKGLIETMRARRESALLAREIAKVKEENARLREEARRLRDDPDAIEEVARRELGLMKPGELLFIIKDVPSPSQPAK